MMIDPFCPCCGNVDEPGWKGCGFTLLWVFYLRILPPFIPWLGQVISHSSLDVVSYVLSLCYGIWFARNKSCFDGKQVLVEDIVLRAWTVADDYNLMLNTHVRFDTSEPFNSPISWKPHVVCGVHNLSNNQSYFSIVFADCNRLSSYFNSFSLSHVKHSVNMTAIFFS